MANQLNNRTMKRDEVIEITQKEALDAIKKAGSKIHCFMGFIGADWSRKDVADLVKKTKRIAWADNMFNHNLAVIAEGRLHNFDIKYTAPLVANKEKK